MVPKRRTSWMETHGSELNGEPPATFAAQIADRFTTNHENSQAQDRDSFQLLLREILESENNKWPTDGPSDSDDTVNSRLLWIIVQAGVGTPSVEDQRKDVANIIPSLQAIGVIVAWSPNAIHQPLESSAPGGAFVPPLFAGLLASLLDKVRESAFDDTEEHVLNLIQRSMFCEKRGAKKSGHSDEFPRYVQACISGML